MKIYVNREGRMAITLSCPSCQYEMEVDLLDTVRKCPVPVDSSILRDFVLQEARCGITH